METKNNDYGTKIDISETDKLMSIPRPVVSVKKEYPPGHSIEYHKHPCSQLLYASSGVMTISTTKDIWVIPPLRAVWINAETVHQVKISGKLSMRSLYIKPDAINNAPDECCIVIVSPMLRELILYAADFPHLYPLGGPEERIINVLLDQINFSKIESLSISYPKDDRLKLLFKSLSKNPGDRRTLEEWGKEIGASGKTLLRHIQSETGVGFNQWRQQIRLLESLKRLAENEPVTTIAMEMGYDSPSAFISMFRKVLGTTPGKYFTNFE